MKNRTAAKVRTVIVTAMSGISMIFAAAFIGISCVCGGAVCIVAKHNEAENREAFERMKDKFSDVLEEFDGLFTAEKATYYSSRGKHNDCFVYNGNPENFVSDCIVFCNAAPIDYDDRHPTDEMVFWCGRKLYIKADTTNRIFFSNVYMEDYSVIEKFEGKYKLVMSLSKFTEEQQEHLKSIQNDYSFEIVLQ